MVTKPALAITHRRKRLAAGEQSSAKGNERGKVGKGSE